MTELTSDENRIDTGGSPASPQGVPAMVGDDGRIDTCEFRCPVELVLECWLSPRYFAFRGKKLMFWTEWDQPRQNA